MGAAAGQLSPGASAGLIAPRGQGSRAPLRVWLGRRSNPRDNIVRLHSAAAVARDAGTTLAVEAGVPHSDRRRKQAVARAYCTGSPCGYPAPMRRRTAKRYALANASDDFRSCRAKTAGERRTGQATALHHVPDGGGAAVAGSRRRRSGSASRWSALPPRSGRLNPPPRRSAACARWHRAAARRTARPDRAPAPAAPRRA